MTVAPRYADYEDALDTGISVPLELPLPACSSSQEGRPAGSAAQLADMGAGPGEARLAAELLSQREQACASVAAAADGQAADATNGSSQGQQPAPLSARRARYFLCRRARVDRVFVDHPIYHHTTDIYGSSANTYVEHFPDLDLRYSILCQAALAAPMLLWPPGAGSAAAAEPGSVGAPIGERAQPNRAAARPAEEGGRASMAALPAAAAQEGGAAEASAGLLFVGNDWPCAPLALRLKHSLQGQRQQQPAQPIPGQVQGPAAGAVDEAGGSGGLAHARVPAGVRSSYVEAREPGAATTTDAAEASAEGASDPAAAGDDAFWPRLAESLQGARMAFAVHNLAYQGACAPEMFPRLCLPESALPPLQWPPPPPAAASDALAEGTAGSACGGVPACKEAGGGSVAERSGEGRMQSDSGAADDAAAELQGLNEAGETVGDGVKASTQEPDGAVTCLNWMHVRTRFIIHTPHHAY